MKNKTIIVLIIIAAIIGYYSGTIVTKNNVGVIFTCSDITAFHFDLLMKKYGVNSNTDKHIPGHIINNNATILNSKLLEICLIDPRK